ncbi:MAG TPA: bifunctional phosphoribosylaminoimidazolecarboxamide formyltransferase/IMP cyclohydrolase [Candidatus Dormibacteraeota bacterium]|jgi:phosphoribosylaminoimidazolecarboxamide formyltransferase/IMP cyclohydrolase|nr:bifunctional phosphoribosylaminoimidazolecarboxamide formyltransferase/IMP cyclohydrolase [Candidatus Dormibacteraeota bacterium]
MTLRALLGVSDKTGLAAFARALAGHGVELVATDGTRRALAAEGIEARAVSDLTGFPEMLDGRVKTLHPAIHAGILARRDVPEHMRQLEQHGFLPIDIVVVSLYPFRETVARGAERDEVVENIDIGGPTMIRAAAKNAGAVAVVTSPRQYGAVLDDLANHGSIQAATRQRLAAEAFAHTAAYDTAVAAYLAADGGAESMPEEFTTGGPRLQELRYGENPHQRGAVYALPGAPGGVAQSRQVQGPALSFTNWLDVDAARRLVADFDQPAAAIIKHTNPCGFAVGSDALDAYRRAFECDPRSAFGGIVALNRPLDQAAAQEIAKTFLEAVVAPAVDGGAVAILQRKERLRLLAVDRPSGAADLDVRSIDGGLLVQTADRVNLDRNSMAVMTRRQPTEAEWEELLTAWRVCRHVKSNAVVIVRDGMAVGVGAGQMSRVEAAEIAVRRAGDRVQGAVAASDAFFPMPDGLETLAAAGVRAVIQPGGSKKDDDVIAAADRFDVAMVAAGERHFRH